jgi:hypothetical protein
MKSPGATVKYRAPSTPSRINWQSTHGPTAPRTRRTRRSRPHKSAVDTHHATINNRYLSNNNLSAMELDRSEAADNQSLDRCSFSNFNNAFITFLAPPPPAHKKAAEKVKFCDKPAKKKMKTIASSDDGGKDMAYTQSTSASAKGLEEPLAFFLDSD